MKTIYAYVEADKAALVPDESIDVANATTVALKRIAWFEGDVVGKEVQNYEFERQNATALNGFVKAGAVFFDTAEEAYAWEYEFMPPKDKDGNIAWQEGVITETINTVKGWFK